MAVRKPHFLLFCDAKVSATRESTASDRPELHCRWQVVLDDLDADRRVELSDREVVSSPERAELISVVRGLESLPQPSEVTLITASPYVNKGLRYGLAAWRENGYRWEHFGSERPIRNADLWRRIDRALEYHEVECRLIGSGGGEDGRGRFTPTGAAEPDAAAEGSGCGGVPSAAALVRVAAAGGRVATSLLGSFAAGLRALTAAAAELSRLPERAVFAAEAAFDAALLNFRGRGVA